MLQTLKLGPLVLSAELAIMIAAILATLAVDAWLARRNRTGAESVLWIVFLIGLIVARAAFVARFPQQYMESPVGILDPRDGGFDGLAGLVAGFAVASWFAWRDRARRRVIVSSLLCGVTLWSGATLATRMVRPDTVPLQAVSLVTLDGSPVSVGAFTGRPIAINLWASWCPPCRREMPVLRDAQATYRDIAFLFVNQGESAETVQKYLGAHGLQLSNVFLDATSQAGRAWGAAAMPSTLFVAADGKLVDTRIGELSAATLAERMQALRRTTSAGEK